MQILFAMVKSLMSSCVYFYLFCYYSALCGLLSNDFDQLLLKVFVKCKIA